MCAPILKLKSRDFSGTSKSSLCYMKQTSRQHGAAVAFSITTRFLQFQRKHIYVQVKIKILIFFKPCAIYLTLPVFLPFMKATFQFLTAHTHLQQSIFVNEKWKDLAQQRNAFLHDAKLDSWIHKAHKIRISARKYLLNRSVLSTSSKNRNVWIRACLQPVKNSHKFLYNFMLPWNSVNTTYFS